MYQTYHFLSLGARSIHGLVLAIDWRNRNHSPSYTQLVEKHVECLLHRLMALNLGVAGESGMPLEMKRMALWDTGCEARFTFRRMLRLGE